MLRIIHEIVPKDIFLEFLVLKMCNDNIVSTWEISRRSTKQDFKISEFYQVEILWTLYFVRDHIGVSQTAT